MSMTFNEYIMEAAETQLHYSDWRVGQTYFNVFREHYPAVARTITATDLDPFYIEKNLPKFLEFVASFLDGDEAPSVESTFGLYGGLDK